MKASCQTTAGNPSWFDRLMHKLFAPRKVWKLKGPNNATLRVQYMGFNLTTTEVLEEHERVKRIARDMGMDIIQVPPEIR